MRLIGWAYGWAPPPNTRRTSTQRRVSAGPWLRRIDLIILPIVFAFDILRVLPVAPHRRDDARRAVGIVCYSAVGVCLLIFRRLAPRARVRRAAGALPARPAADRRLFSGAAPAGGAGDGRRNAARCGCRWRRWRQFCCPPSLLVTDAAVRRRRRRCSRRRSVRPLFYGAIDVAGLGNRPVGEAAPLVRSTACRRCTPGRWPGSRRPAENAVSGRAAADRRGAARHRRAFGDDHGAARGRARSGWSIPIRPGPRSR